MATVVSYTTVSLMQMTLAEVGSISTMTDSVLLLHAGAAEALINATISKRYSLPFTQEIPLLESLATDMGIYRVLTGRITINKEHPWFARFKNATETLKDIAEGKIELVSSSGEALTGKSSGSTQVWSNTKDYKSTMWEGPWSLMEPDSNKIEDEANDRDIRAFKDKLT